MSLARRVHSLEVARGMGRCTECGGKGKIVVSHHCVGEPEPVAEGCASCGAIHHLIIRFVDESLTGQPIVESGRRLTGAELGALLS